VLQAEEASPTQLLFDEPADESAFTDAPEPLDVHRIEKAFRRQALANVGWFARTRRRAARFEAHVAAEAVAEEQVAKALIEAERLHSDYYAYSRAMNAHDRDAVVATVDDAFARNAPEATCVDAGTDSDAGRYVSCVITYGHPDLVPDLLVTTTPTGQPALGKRSMADMNNSYVAAMASTVLATVRQALAVAPTADEVRLAALRKERSGAGPEWDRGVSAIYVGVFRRSDMERLSWRAIDTEAELMSAGGAELVRKGDAQSVVALGAGTQRRMVDVLHAFADADDEDGEPV